MATTEKQRKQRRKKQRKYYKENREAWNKYQREYKKRRYAEDPVFRARMREYARLRRLAKKQAELHTDL
jgi:hypothetical protein